MNYFGFTITSAVVSLLFIYLHFIADARCDNIMFKRTAKGMHPYRDYWHLQKAIRRLSMFFAGIFYCAQIVFSLKSRFPLIIIILSVVQLFVIFMFFIKKWNTIAFEQRDKYLDKDETQKISTGMGWLDRWLGLHN